MGDVFQLVEFVYFLVMVMIRAFRHGIIDRVWKTPTIDPCPAGALTGAVVGVGAVAGAMLNLSRSKQELALENALLRQQLIVLRR